MQGKSKSPPATNRLRQLRVDRGLKLYDLAAQLRVDPSTIHRWERGAGMIPDERKLALAEFFGVTVEHLMGWEREAA